MIEEKSVVIKRLIRKLNFYNFHPPIRQLKSDRPKSLLLLPPGLAVVKRKSMVTFATLNRSFQDVIPSTALQIQADFGHMCAIFLANAHVFWFRIRLFMRSIFQAILRLWPTMPRFAARSG